jgi:RHS repeat-associated protein
VLDNNDGVITKYQNGLGIDNKLKLTTNGTSKYFLQDHLGSTTGLANSSGSLVDSTSYDSFGNASSNLSTRYTYTGREYDNFTGLYYYRARFYDAKLGRFISEDPIGFAGGDVNLYGYVRNNSINLKDPRGLDIVVVENGPTAGNPIGHTALGITGCGVITFGNANPDSPGTNGICGDFNEYINREAKKRDTTLYVIPTTPEQDKSALESAFEIDYWRPPLQFISDLPIDNCSLRSNEILDAAGIPNNTWYPYRYPGSAGQRAYNLGSSPYFIPQNETADILGFQPYYNWNSIGLNR